MALLDQILKSAGQSSGGGQGSLTEMMSGLLDPKGSGGGLASLVQGFQQKGLGGVVNSWVGTGNNEPISREQVREGLGDDVVQALSERSGMKIEDVAAQLSGFLPSLIDKLTPEGRLPGGQAAQGGGFPTGMLVTAVTALFRGKSGGGGLASIIQAFQQKGLGDLAKSWVGTGENRPVTAQQVQQGLGDDLLASLAAQTGTKRDDVATQLSSLLPNLVDKVTPKGEIPDENELEEALRSIRHTSH